MTFNNLSFLDDDADWTRLRGTYLFPLKVFADERPDEPAAFTEVVDDIEIDTLRVLVTRGGGAFVEDIDSMEFKDVLPFQDRVCDALNVLVCELALHGVITEPVSPAHINGGKLIDGHASVVLGGGAILERGFGPLLTLLSTTENGWPARNFSWLPAGSEILGKARGLGLSKKLSTVNPGMPRLVASAHYNFFRRQIAEAIIDSWVVVEQVMSSDWSDLVASIAKSDSKRRDRLSDYRTYTAAVRLELLLDLGVYDEALVSSLHLARMHRNALAHNAKVSLAAADDCMKAMKAILERICGAHLPNAIASKGFASIGFSRRHGGPLLRQVVETFMPEMAAHLSQSESDPG